jgi:hypothetical protein
VSAYAAAAITPSVTTNGSGPSPDFTIDYQDQKIDTVPAVGGSVQVLREAGRVAWGPVVDVRYYSARQPEQDVAISGSDAGEAFTDRTPLPRIDEPSLDVTAGLAFTWRTTPARRPGTITLFTSVGAGVERQRLEFQDESQLKVTDTAPAVRVGGGLEVAATSRIGLFVAYDFLTSKHTVDVAGENDTTRNNVHHLAGGVRFAF